MVRFRARTVLVVLAAALLPWLDILQTVPHNHADAEVTRESFACVASAPDSHETHLHSPGDRVAAHPCLACLVGSAHADRPSRVVPVQAHASTPCDARRPDEVRPRSLVHIPLLRGPPRAD